ncbi:MAG: hypothetical protein V4506_18165 [Bacteroidota bacterium]
MDSSLQEQCKQFGEILGLKEPVSEHVLKVALQNESYSRNLLVSRESPDILSFLLQNPPKTESSETKYSNLELASRATKALLKWSKTGFSTVSLEVLERRENACLSCEHITKPETTLQKLVTSKAKEQIGKRVADCVCKLCGCSLSKKIRLPSEACPAMDPHNSQLNRWGESIMKAG